MESEVREINVAQFICPLGFYGAEMWILALLKYLDPDRINCRLAITVEDERKNIDAFHHFRAAGLEVYQVRMKGRFDIRGIIELVRFIKSHRIDIINTHGYKSDTLGIVAAKIAGIKSATTPHGLSNIGSLKDRIYSWIGCCALKHFDCVVPLSEELQSDMVRIGVRPEKIKLIQNGVDLEEVEAERNHSREGAQTKRAEKIIGYVGQLIDRKNLKDLIAAFDLLNKDHDNVKLILIGDGAQRCELEKLVKSLPSATHIAFLGYRKDRLSLMKEMDVFSMTSSREGIPR